MNNTQDLGIAGRVAAAFQNNRLTPLLALVALLLGWMGGEAIRAHPDYLVYLNELARGPGWQYLSDSNIEWGDDTEALAAYLHAQGEHSVRAAVSAKGRRAGSIAPARPAQAVRHWPAGG